jgi:hypothetical protein
MIPPTGAEHLFKLLTAVGGPAPAPEAVRQQLDKILARAEFNQKAPNLAWLGKALRSLFAWLGTLYDTSPVLFWLILVVCLVLLVLIGFHIGWTIRQAFIVGDTSAANPQANEQRRRQSQGCRQQALDHAARGEYTEAIRFLFLSLVYRFDEQGRVLFQRSYTNREYLELFADRPRVTDDLRVFVDTLDEHWYGQRPTDMDRYRECLSLYERLQRQG